LEKKDEEKLPEEANTNNLPGQMPKNMGTMRSKVMRGGSIESLPSEPANATNNFTGSFYLPGFGNSEFEVEVEKLFKSSGFGLNLPAPEHSTPSAKEIFADSGLGLKRNEALLQFSAMSVSGMSGGDDHNSFFNLTSDKGVIETEDLINSKELERLQGSKKPSGRSPFCSSFDKTDNVFSRLEFSGSMFKNYIPDIPDIETEKVTKEEGFGKKE
jgi:hypothetical protein